MKTVPFPRTSWATVLAAGTALWLLGLASIWVSHNILLLPAVLIGGGMLAPVTLAVWAYQRTDSSSVSTARLLVAMTVGGTVSFLITGVIGTWLVPTPLPAALRAGLLEELAKLLAVIALAAGMSRRRARDGILLGAAVGLGFAALENTGYALRAFAMGGNSLSSLLSNQLSRNLQTPVTHALWTALAGGVLLAAARAELPRWARLGVVTGGFLGAAALHAFWDVATSISLRVAADVAAWRLPGVTAVISGLGVTVAWDTVWFVMVGISSLIGVVALHALWQRERPEPATNAQIVVPPAQGLVSTAPGPSDSATTVIGPSASGMTRAPRFWSRWSVTEA
jgi:RsiW-degrading membrane proteinase PrsW (M82 family)